MSGYKKYESALESLRKQMEYHQQKVEKYRNAMGAIQDIMVLEGEEDPNSGELVGPADAIRMYFDAYPGHWKPKDVKIGIQKMIDGGDIKIDSVRDPQGFVDSTLRNLVKSKYLGKETKDNGIFYYHIQVNV